MHRRAVLEDHNYTCEKSGKQGKNVEVHHIYNWADRPDKRFDLSCTACLTKKEHVRFHSIYGQIGNNWVQYLDFLVYR